MERLLARLPVLRAHRKRRWVCWLHATRGELARLPRLRAHRKRRWGCWLAVALRLKGIWPGLGHCLGLRRHRRLLGWRARPCLLARLARLAQSQGLGAGGGALCIIRWHDGEWRDAMREGKDETA